MCGICGMVSNSTLPLAHIVDLLTLVNHRGNEATGIAAMRAFHTIDPFIELGYVRDACTAKNSLFVEFSRQHEALAPNAALGHVRYSTVGSSNVAHGQPKSMVHPKFGRFFLVHNGQIPMHQQIRTQLEQAGQRFETESDTETLAALLAHAPVETLPDAVAHIIRTVPGAFSIIVLDSKYMIAARDVEGFWPLWYGQTSLGDMVFSSEAGTMRDVAEPIEVERGAMVFVKHTATPIIPQITTIKTSGCGSKCWMDAAYLARPDESLGTIGVLADLREQLGMKLADHYKFEADLVCGVPDSGLDAARGLSGASRIPFTPRAIVRNRFAFGSRSFILPTAQAREAAISVKHSVTRRLVDGKRVLIVDDTIVRSNTARMITALFRKAGATEIHWAIAAPRIIHPCFYGIDIPWHRELIASEKTDEEIAAAIGANSVHYLPQESSLQVLNSFQSGWCMACVDGHYPIEIP